MSKAVNHLEIYRSHTSPNAEMKYFCGAALICAVAYLWKNSSTWVFSAFLAAIFLALFLYWLYCSGHVLLSVRDEKKGRTAEIQTCKFKIEGNVVKTTFYDSGLYFINIPDNDETYYDPDCEDRYLCLQRYTYTIALDGEKLLTLHAVYTVGKYNKICNLYELMGYGNYQYPLRFSYYAKGGILISVDLIEGVDYPAFFVERFTQIKNAI